MPDLNCPTFQAQIARLSLITKNWGGGRPPPPPPPPASYAYEFAPFLLLKPQEYIDLKNVKQQPEFPHKTRKTGFFRDYLQNGFNVNSRVLNRLHTASSS